MAQYLNKLKIDGKEMQVNDRKHFGIEALVNIEAVMQTVATLNVTAPGFYIINYGINFPESSFAEPRFVRVELWQGDTIRRGVQSQRAANQWAVDLSGSVTTFCDAPSMTLNLMSYVESPMSSPCRVWIDAEWVMPAPG